MTSKHFRGGLGEGASCMSMCGFCCFRLRCQLVASLLALPHLTLRVVRGLSRNLIDGRGRADRGLKELGVGVFGDVPLTGGEGGGGSEFDESPDGGASLRYPAGGGAKRRARGCERSTRCVIY